MNDLTGKRFGELTALYYLKNLKTQNGSHISKWMCECSCGNKIAVYASHLTRGNTKSCGCKKGEGISKRKTLPPNLFEKIDGLWWGVVKNKFAFCISEEDYDIISSRHWNINSNGYVIDGHHRYLHRLLCEKHYGNIKNLEVDHINGCVWDNRLENLRVVQHADNIKNEKVKNKYGVSGVYRTTKGTYAASIISDNVEYYLGTYKNVTDAIMARLEAEKKYHSEYSRNACTVNVPIIPECYCPKKQEVTDGD